MLLLVGRRLVCAIQLNCFLAIEEVYCFLYHLANCVCGKLLAGLLMIH